MEDQRLSAGVPGSEVSFRQLVDAIPHLVWSARPDGTVDYCSQRRQEFAGLIRNPDGSWEWRALLHPDDLAPTVSAWEGAVATGESYEVEHRLQRADGDYRWYLSRAVAVRDESGEIGRWYGTATDIHEQKMAEEMQEARDLFQRLFHASPLPTAITDLRDGRFVDVNEAHLAYFGWQRDEVIGRTSAELNLWFDATDRERFVAGMQERGFVREGQVRFRHPTKGVRSAFMSVVRVELNGEPHSLGSFVDITPQVEAERRVRHLASELLLAEQRERQRVSQLLHDDLQQLLVALQLNMKMLKNGLATEQAAEVQAMGDVVDEAVELARSLASELSVPDLAGNSLADAFSWLVQLMADRYQLRVHAHVAQEVRVERREVREFLLRVVRELLFNVVKHAGVDEAWLAAWLEDGELVVQVRDEGSGFTDASGGETGRRARGFGLTSVRERLELLGGQLEVGSAPGSGTRCTLRLPLQAESDSIPPSA